MNEKKYNLYQDIIKDLAKERPLLAFRVVIEKPFIRCINDPDKRLRKLEEHIERSEVTP